MKIRKFYIIFFLTILTVSISQYVVDLPLMIFFHDYFPYSIEQFGIIISYLGNGWIIVPIGLVLTGLFFIIPSQRKKSLSFISIFLSSLILSGFFSYIMKCLFGRSRPSLYFSHHLYGFYGFSLSDNFHAFPSGHVTTAAAAFWAIYCFFKPIKYFSISAILLVSFARMITYHHYLSDTITGAFIGIATTQWCMNFLSQRTLISLNTINKLLSCFFFKEDNC